jgi:phospholipid-transporting ATPase
MVLDPNKAASTVNFFLELAISFGTWFLALMNFVPISLMVSLEVVKFFQGYFIE